MALARPVFFTARTKVTPVQIKRAIYHAKSLCQDYENTQNCKIAWDIVEELTAELARQHEEDLFDSTCYSERAKRMYDI
jgi:predicted adenine nucleotide alpha hydrolase (AANH) superfamily ATPase